MESVKIEFSRQEVESLVGLLDAGVRAVGLRSVKEAAVLIDKLENALSVKPENVENK